MIDDYLATALQVFRKNPLTTLINIGGLALGMAACLLIALHITDELSFDEQFKNQQNILRVEQRLLLKGTTVPASPLLSVPASNELKTYGEPIESVTKLVSLSRVVRHGQEQNFEQVMFATANFFEVFDFSSMIDQPERALTDANSILISQEMAEKYFADSPPVGEVLTLDNKVDYEVIGVFPELPGNVHFRFDFITLLEEERDLLSGPRYNWSTATTFTYIEVADQTNIARLATQLDDFLQNAAHRNWPRDGSVGFKYVLTPLAAIHLYSESRFDMTPPGNINTVFTFGVIAALILAIASINYVNLTTARASQRAREVSVRKALGATRGQLIVQFLLESVVLTVIALTLALSIVVIVLPWFNDFLDKDLYWSLASGLHALLALGVVLLVGVVGGLYPAFVLSSFRPARVLRANQSTVSGSPWLRNALVVIQYSVSITLILVTVLIVRQTEFARQFDLGFDTARKINISVNNPDVRPHIGVLENELRRIPEVTGFTMMRRPLPSGLSYLWEMSIPQFSNEGGQRVANYEVDDEFFSVFKLEVIAGRVFSAEYQADKFVTPDKRNQSTEGQTFSVGSIVVNESLLKMFGIPDPQSALGVRVYIEPQNQYRNVEVVIVGVVRDAHFDSIHNETRGSYFSLRDKEELGAMTLSLDTTDLESTMADIDRVWKEIVPDVPITRHFVDTVFNDLYQREERRGKLFSYFATLAITLSCLGLYGLASFTASRRRKEISIRRVLGASVWDVVLLLLVQFTKPLLIAALIGFPLAVLFINDWLQGFAYRIELIEHAYLFPLVFFGLLLIAWTTVSVHAIKAACLKPVASLREE